MSIISSLYTSCGSILNVLFYCHLFISAPEIDPLKTRDALACSEERLPRDGIGSDYDPSMLEETEDASIETIQSTLISDSSFIVSNGSYSDTRLKFFK